MSLFHLTETLTGPALVGRDDGKGSIISSAQGHPAPFKRHTGSSHSNYSCCRLRYRCRGPHHPARVLARRPADHAIRPPEPFVSHVLATIDEFETAGREESWWRNQGRGF